jgi:hypothetical protein
MELSRRAAVTHQPKETAVLVFGAGTAIRKPRDAIDTPKARVFSVSIFASQKGVNAVDAKVYIGSQNCHLIRLSRGGSSSSESVC